MKNCFNAKSLKRQIRVARGAESADLVIKNCRAVNVFSCEITDGDIAIVDGIVVGIGSYSGKNEIDAHGAYAIPGLIDSHIHIESSFLTPEEFGRLAVPFGTTTVIADPHEIVNVCGMDGFKFMVKASEKTALDIKFMVPSCVPATEFETSGARFDSKQIAKVMGMEKVLGLGELMNYVDALACEDEMVKKIAIARKYNKFIDGHAPDVAGKDRQAYAAFGARTDHESSTLQEMRETIQCGMYVEMRDGSACHDLENLAAGVTEKNSRRCLLCSDDRHPVIFYKKGHVNSHLRICVQKGIDPITAIQMGSLNAAHAYHLYDRGAIAPGFRADIVLVDNLENFDAQKVFIKGELVAQDGKYLKAVKKVPIKKVASSVNIKNYSKEKLTLRLSDKSEKVTVHAIELSPGSIVTKDALVQTVTDEGGNFVFDPDVDLVKIAVVERHHNTGNVGLALLKNYGIKQGAVALTVAHDSHNIICAGTDDEQMDAAIRAVEKAGGGIALIHQNKQIAFLPLPVAGLMSDRDAVWVKERLEQIHEAAKVLGVNPKIGSVSTLCFMALPVIPELKVTDKGLFDVRQFKFVDIRVN
ncbi:MAG: adenine deaminase [Treponema sp.]|nr:adenine deaminase [Treponema sp.]